MRRIFTYPSRPLGHRATVSVIVVLSAVLLAVAVAALSIGSVSIGPATTFRALIGDQSVPQVERTILLDIRLPRILLAILAGAGLSVAGVVFQALLRNPLAEPYILGISSGGTVGAVAGITLSLGLLGVPLLSFFGSALVMLVVYSVAHRRGQLDAYALLLAGVMIGAFFNAAVLLIIALSAQELRKAFLWLMGNLGSVTMESLAVVGPLILATSILLFRYARSYNLIATGDEAALQLGVDVRRVKRITYLLASLITGLVVSVSGVIGFVGLIIPHICRMLFGPDHRLLLPSAALLGAAFLVVADLIARIAVSPSEIPVGAVTAAIGAPLFIYLLRKT